MAIKLRNSSVTRDSTETSCKVGRKHKVRKNTLTFANGNVRNGHGDGRGKQCNCDRELEHTKGVCEDLYGRGRALNPLDNDAEGMHLDCGSAFARATLLDSVA